MVKIDKPRAGTVRVAPPPEADALVEVVHESGRTKFVRPERVLLMGPQWTVVADEPPVNTDEPGGDRRGSDPKE